MLRRFHLLLWILFALPILTVAESLPEYTDRIALFKDAADETIATGDLNAFIGFLKSWDAETEVQWVNQKGDSLSNRVNLRWIKDSFRPGLEELGFGANTPKK